ncbi:sel1 repeat family protein [Pseudomonas qingdaonensis]|uniref:Sel1 repeat family protein n=1 Tax=Pseudomonas qingdaonensis TaxID=2056231 RepID=A0ABX8DYL2_9PSED|nr:tetratricopeptide repeat protein [Pseudomonas qingdaonensis]QVL21426.1 sel1 repeat family protein [Pseudomonas qingdaonensis]
MQVNGNKAAHPEGYDFVDLDFPQLAAEALEAARGLVECLYTAAHKDVPAYDLAIVESGSLKEMCARAMLDRDPEAMSQAGEYFLERAEQFPKFGLTRPDRYHIDAGADIEHSMFWFKQGADNDHPNCAYRYGYYLIRHLNVERNQEIRGEWYITKAADADHPEAVLYLAQSALEGLGSFTIDEVHALELFERAAELGSLKAVSQVGAMYASGRGCEVCPQKAAQYTLKAAYAGDPQAQYNLSVLYANGTNGLKSESEAIKWLQESAAQEFPEAVYDFACYIMEGHVPGRAPAEAEAEFEKAMQFDKFRARAAVLAAQMIYEREHSLDDLIRAAEHLQACYEMVVKEGGQDDLKELCLEACKDVVGALREHINKHGTAPNMKCSDVFCSLFFDQDCVPVADRETRWMQVVETLVTLGQSDAEAGTQYLLREACLPTRKKVRIPEVVQMAVSSPEIGLHLFR